ncbi:MAG TPA: 50S ribosomal protein L3 [Gammaproteobacteria bacterium]|jgi:large subunit ribosomal protein L3|nr:50S ribosomal protein L3 [Gammaproteobacteria bacterium]
MSIGVIGRKCGMTRVFAEDGASIPVTVIQVESNRITQVKGVDADGYRSIQVTTGVRRATRVTKAMAGHYAKAGTGAGRLSGEFRLGKDEGADLKAGGEIKADIFKPGQYVDVTGTSIGKGFQGTIKRHHFTMGDATHGNSLSHRAPGSIGQRQTPGRVFPGKKMSGHLGAKRRTAINLQVVQVDAEKNLLLVKGAVPGSEGGNVIVRPSARG